MLEQVAGSGSTAERVHRSGTLTVTGLTSVRRKQPLKDADQMEKMLLRVGNDSWRGTNR